MCFTCRHQLDRGITQLEGCGEQCTRPAGLARRSGQARASQPIKHLRITAQAFLVIRADAKRGIYEIKREMISNK
jgi:hypothetical protein